MLPGFTLRDREGRVLQRATLATGFLAAWAVVGGPTGPAAGGGAQAVLDHQPPELVKRLFEKKVLVMAELGPRGTPKDALFVAFVIFEATPEQAYRLLAETARHIEFRPEVRGMETVARNEIGNVDEHRMKVLFLDVAYRVQYRFDPARKTIHWELDSAYDNALRRADGFWEFYALEKGRALGRFGAVVDVGPALPKFLQTWVTRKNLPRTLERARRWVDSGGSYRP